MSNSIFLTDDIAKQHSYVVHGYFKINIAIYLVFKETTPNFTNTLANYGVPMSKIELINWFWVLEAQMNVHSFGSAN